jgi:protoheme IX farnesyltransferase
MLGYTVMLVPLTVLPWLSGTQGALYAIAAVLLGGRLLWYCVKLLREPEATPLAWRMYKFSLVYLALLFLAMAVDRLVPFGQIRAPAQLVLVRSSEGHRH